MNEGVRKRYYDSLSLRQKIRYKIFHKAHRFEDENFDRPWWNNYIYFVLDSAEAVSCMALGHKFDIHTPNGTLCVWCRKVEPK